MTKPQWLSISLRVKVKVITIAYDTFGSFPSHSNSLIFAIRTLPFATLLQVSWPPCCSPDTPSKFPPHSLCIWCSLCLECSLPDVQNACLCFSALFLSAVLIEICSEHLIQKKKKKATFLSIHLSPYPALFLLPSALYVFWFVCIPSISTH